MYPGFRVWEQDGGYSLGLWWKWLLQAPEIDVSSMSRFAYITIRIKSENYENLLEQILVHKLQQFSLRFLSYVQIIFGNQH